ncbi:hypothetical protein [Ferrovibrio sp.]|uniref:hypothetical protein n=1 Tax=Ferrovibrio sp. TaxID=1917215 RepID=UPI002635FF5B|nr:hypothetical protein [Ferrovibrio sp.]
MVSRGSELALSATAPFDVACPEVAAEIGRDFLEALERFIHLSGQPREAVYKASGKTRATLEKWGTSGRIDVLTIERLDLYFASLGVPGFKSAIIYGLAPEVRWSGEPLPVELVEEGILGDLRAARLFKAWRTGENLIDLMFKLQLEAETTLFHVDADKVALLRVGQLLPVDVSLLNRDAGDRKDRTYGAMMRGQILRTAEDGVTLFHNRCRWQSTANGGQEDHYWRLGVARDGQALLFPFKRKLSPRYWVD